MPLISAFMCSTVNNIAATTVEATPVGMHCTCCVFCWRNWFSLLFNLHAMLLFSNNFQKNVSKVNFEYIFVVLL